jgi:hypothetical protein
MAAASSSVLWLAQFESPLPQPWVDAQIAALSDSERSRLARIRRPLRREQFVLGHALLRQVLVAVGLSAPVIEVRDTGQAHVRSDDAHATDRDWHLSLAHSGGKLAALVASEPVGVDIEIARQLRDAAGIVAYLGTAPAAPGADLHTVALQAWVIAEARSKAGSPPPPLSPADSARVYTTQWNGCWLAVAGSTKPPDCFVSDPLLGTYNPLPLSWTAH